MMVPERPKKPGRGRHDYTFESRCVKCWRAYPRDMERCPIDGARLRHKPKLYHATRAFTEEITDADRALIASQLKERLHSLLHSSEFEVILLNHLHKKTMDELVRLPKVRWTLRLETTVFNRDMLVMLIQSKTGERKSVPAKVGRHTKDVVSELDPVSKTEGYGHKLDSLGYKGDPPPDESEVSFLTVEEA